MGGETSTSASLTAEAVYPAFSLCINLSSPPPHAFDFIRLEQGARLILVRHPFGMNSLTGSAWIYPSCRYTEHDNNSALDCGLSFCCLRQPCPLSHTQRKRE